MERQKPLDNIELTITMPVFNHTSQVRVMIDSILANSFQDWELLAVDDGSEQDTLDLLDEYARKDNRIRVIHRSRQPKGAQSCRNIGLEEANGEFIVFFDSDDYVIPDSLETRVRLIKSRPELDFLVFPSGLYNDQVGFQAYAQELTFGYPVYSDDLQAFASRNLPFIVWSNIYRTASLRKAGITWDPELLSLQDSNFNVESLLAGLCYDYALTYPDYGYRREPSTDSISAHVLSRKHFETQLYTIDKFFRLYQLHFKHKYDRALYEGAATLCFRLLLSGYDKQLIGRIPETIGRYTKCWQRTLRLQISIAQCLKPILGNKFSAKIAMSPNILYRFRITKLADKRRNALVNTLNQKQGQTTGQIRKAAL